MKVFYGNFEEDETTCKPIDLLCKEYDITEEVIESIDIIYADYEYISYDGESFVLFSKYGELYEVNGSHCSCYGLEGQWNPEPTTAEAILARPKIPNEAKQNLREYLHMDQ